MGLQVQCIHALYMRGHRVLDGVPARISNLAGIYVLVGPVFFSVYIFFVGVMKRQDIMSYMATCFCHIYVYLCICMYVSL